VEAIYKGHRLLRPVKIHPISERRYRMNRFITTLLRYIHRYGRGQGAGSRDFVL
jgi:hypothetical protein